MTDLSTQQQKTDSSTQQQKTIQQNLNNNNKNNNNNDDNDADDIIQYNPQEEYHAMMENLCDIWWEHRLKNYNYDPPWIQTPLKILQLQEEETNRTKTWKNIL